VRKPFYSNDKGQVGNSFIVRKVKERKEEIMKIERGQINKYFRTRNG